MDTLRWMSSLRGDAKLTKIVMPGAHNAGTRGILPIACCQDGTIAEQISFGVRHFCLRIDTDIRGRIVICHGPVKGMPLTEVFEDFAWAMEAAPSEFFILDLREYYPQSFGPIKMRYKAAPAAVNKLVRDYLSPEKYALTDFDRIGDVTMDDIRRSGKRFLLLNYRADYEYSVACEHIFPWDSELYATWPDYFYRHVTDMLDQNETEGLFWFQIQQTPKIGSPIGTRTPRKLDEVGRKDFDVLMDRLAANPKWLDKLNIIGGDFMTSDVFKCLRIIALNENKGLFVKGDE